MSDKAKNRIETPEIFTTGLTNNRFFSPTLQFLSGYIFLAFLLYTNKIKNHNDEQTNKKAKTQTKERKMSQILFPWNFLVMLVLCAHMQSIKTVTYSLQITESKYHTLLFLRYVHFALQHLTVLQVIVLLERRSPDSFISK